MPTQRLENLLHQVQLEIEQLDDSSSAEKQRLEKLIAEIEAALANDEAEAHESFIENTNAKLIEMESEHPTASGIVRRLMQVLSDMGI